MALINKLIKEQNQQDYWQEFFGQTKECIISEYHKAKFFGKESLIEKTYNKACSMLDNMRSEFIASLKYHYAFQALMLGLFPLCYSTFKDNINIGETSFGTIVILVIGILGLVHIIIFGVNYYAYNRSVAECYRNIIILEPYMFGKLYSEQSKNYSIVFGKWQAAALFLFAFIWVGILIYFAHPTNKSEYFTISIGLVEIILFIFLSIMVIFIFLHHNFIKLINKAHETNVWNKKNTD